MQQSKVDNYHSERGALAYQRDHETKLHRKVSTRIELRILAGLFGEIAADGPIDRVLDLPCGTGRLFEFLQGLASEVWEADFSPTMLELNRELHDSAADRYIECSALDVPLPDRSVDVTLSVRLNHHLETLDDRLAHLSEAMRLSRRAVVVTFFDAASLKNLLREIRRPFNKKRSKFSLRRKQVREHAREHGYRVQRFAALSHVGSGHVFALLTRDAR